MEVCNCVWSESAAERCMVSQQQQEQQQQRGAFWKFFPLCVADCISPHRQAPRVHTDVVPSAMVAITLQAYTHRYSLTPFCPARKAFRLIRCKPLALRWRAPRYFDT